MAALNQTGAQSLSVGIAPVGLSLPGGNHTRPRRALIQVRNQPIRWRADGTPPTDISGQFVGAGNYIEWTDPSDFYDAYGLIANVKFVRDAAAGADATLEVAFFA